MKFLSKITCLLLMIITVLSCDKVDELTNFDVTEDFDTTISVDITEDSEDIGFEESITIDIASNDRIQENLKLIDEVSIASLTYQFMDYDALDAVTLSDASITMAGITIEIDDIDVEAASSAGTVYTVTNTSLLEAIASSLKNNPEVTATFAATISSSPVSFDVIVTLDATVTIDVLYSIKNNHKKREPIGSLFL